MAAEFHLAEDALALHLPLKHLEGLVDIVVTDENLHAAFLFDRAAMGPVAKAPGPLARIGIVRIPMEPDVRTKGRYLRTCLPIGTTAANWKKQRLRYVAVFWAALQTNTMLTCITKWACRR
jgi:hypothetical protein